MLSYQAEFNLLQSKHWAQEDNILQDYIFFFLYLNIHQPLLLDC